MYIYRRLYRGILRNPLEAIRNHIRRCRAIIQCPFFAVPTDVTVSDHQGTRLARLERSPAKAEGRQGERSGGEIVPVLAPMRGNAAAAKVEALPLAGRREDARGPERSGGAMVNVSRSAPTFPGATRSPSESDSVSRDKHISGESLSCDRHDMR